MKSSYSFRVVTPGVCSGAGGSSMLRLGDFLAQHLSQHVHAADDGEGLHLLRVLGQERALGQDARPLGRVQVGLLQGIARHPGGAVVGGQRPVDEGLVGGEQFLQLPAAGQDGVDEGRRSRPASPWPPRARRSCRSRPSPAGPCRRCPATACGSRAWPSLARSSFSMRSAWAAICSGRSSVPGLGRLEQLVVGHGGPQEVRQARGDLVGPELDQVAVLDRLAHQLPAVQELAATATSPAARRAPPRPRARRPRRCEAW